MPSILDLGTAKGESLSAPLTLYKNAYLPHVVTIVTAMVSKAHDHQGPTRYIKPTYDISKSETFYYLTV